MSMWLVLVLVVGRCVVVGEQSLAWKCFVPLSAVVARSSVVARQVGPGVVELVFAQIAVQASRHVVKRRVGGNLNEVNVTCRPCCPSSAVCCEVAVSCGLDSMHWVEVEREVVVAVHCSSCECAVRLAGGVVASGGVVAGLSVCSGGGKVAGVMRGSVLLDPLLLDPCKLCAPMGGVFACGSRCECAAGSDAVIS
eukprot:57811-Amphidinium_carterae.1